MKTNQKRPISEDWNQAREEYEKTNTKCANIK